MAASSLFAMTGIAHGQQRLYKVAWLSGAEKSEKLRQLFVARLASAGFVENQNLQVVERHADGRLERLPILARELANENPDVFMVSGTQAALAAREVTRTASIVFAFVGDPIASGLVADLSHPVGNITGFTAMTFELIGKRLQVLREAFPSIKTVGVFTNPRNAPETSTVEILRKTAGDMGIDIAVVNVTGENDFKKAFAAMASHRPDAFFVLENATNVTHRQQIFDFVNRHRIPAIYGFESFVYAGGLMSYCASQADQVAGAADYVVRLLRGERVAELPVRRPDRFALVINVKTAKASGISIPQAMLLRADEIIE